MKIIGTDTLARETVADKLLISDIPNTDYNRLRAKSFCNWLNKFTCDELGGTYYRVVDNDYRLSRGMEDLI